MAKCDKCGKEVLVQNSLLYLQYFELELRINGGEYGLLRRLVNKISSTEDLCQQDLEDLKASVTAREKHLGEVQLEMSKLALECAETDRHLVPKDGCEGSPSSYQYLEGYPKDNRPGAVYEERKVIRARNAYAALQEWCKQKTEFLC